MDDTKYFSRSWALLTRDKGWIKPLLVMAAASLVPVVGEFGNSGYALEWGRLTAWGVDAAPKQKDVEIGKCISSGARAFVVSLGLGVAIGIVFTLIRLVFSLIPGTIGSIIYAMVSMALSVVMSVASLVIMLAQLRCAIYEQISAGYRLDRIFELIGRDTKGFLRVFLINFLCGLVIAAIVMVFVFVGMLLLVPVIIGMSGGYQDQRMASTMIIGIIVPLILGCVLFGYLLAFLGNAVRLIVTTSLALWLRQFDVPKWGRSEDPLPEGVGPQPSTMQYAQQPMQQPPVNNQWQQPVQQQQPAQQWQQPVQQQPMQQPVQQPAQQQPAQQQPMQQQVPTQAQQPSQQPPTIVIPHRSEAEDLYDSMADAIKDNDRVEGDD